MFPPFKPSNTIVKSEYDSFNYWRDSAQLQFLDEIENEIKKETILTAKEMSSIKPSKNMLKSQSTHLVNISEVDKKTNEI